MALPHIGNWGLPDFGITEGIAGILNKFDPQSQSTNITTNTNQPQNFQTAEQIVQQRNAGTLKTPGNQTLGASTTSGGGGQVVQNPQVPQGGGQPSDPYAGLRGEINSGWDQYLGSLDNQLYSLGDQRTAQEGIANSQYNQGVNTLDLQNSQGQTALQGQETQANQNQAKTLRDLAGNLKNSFMAGNVYLGSRGAGDSSAANQYAFALTKMGSQQRGDIMNNTANIINDIRGRMTNLTNIYNTEKKNLTEGLNQQVQGIAQWYSNAVQSLQQQKAQGQLAKSQDLQSLSKDILNQALSQLSNIQQAAQQRQSSLDSWAMSNSQNLSQLKTNLSAVANPTYQLPQMTALTGTPQLASNGSMYIPSGYGNNSNEKKTTLFG